MHNQAICHSFDSQRQDLLAGVSEVLRPFVEINRLSNNDLIEILIYGNEKLSDDANKKILHLTLDFIYKTGRFD